MMKKLLMTGFCLFAVCRIWAQQAYTVTDKQPVVVDGLEIGYNIKSEEVKEVSGKGNFSRFSVRFYVSNPGNQAKMMLYKQGLNLFNNVSDQLVQFNCLNATGARLTSKTATISAPVCNLLALVDDKDANGKTVQNKRFVQVGYWVRAGETVSADVILIVPLNEKPNVQFVYLANNVMQPGMATIAGNRPTVMQDVNVNPPSYGSTAQPYSRIKSMFNNSYINVESGPVRSTPITGDWFSAQWQLIPVPGTEYYNITNKWKLNYLAIKSGNIELSPKFDTATSMWTLEPTAARNIFRLKNMETRRYLCIIGDELTTSMSPGVGFNSSWTLERPQ